MADKFAGEEPKQNEVIILGMESSGIELTADIVKACFCPDVNISKDCKSSYGAFYLQ